MRLPLSLISAVVIYLPKSKADKRKSLLGNSKNSDENVKASEVCPWQNYLCNLFQKICCMWHLDEFWCLFELIRHFICFLVFFFLLFLGNICLYLNQVPRCGNGWVCLFFLSFFIYFFVCLYDSDCLLQNELSNCFILLSKNM